MNFQTISQIRNQKDQKGYPVRMDMWAAITEIGGTQSTQNGKAFAKCKLRDDQGALHNVTIYNIIPPLNLLNSRQVFSLSSFDGNYQGKPYVGYSGFWQHNAGGQQRSQGMMPPPPTRSGAMGAPQASKDTSIERQCAWKSACTVATSSSREFTLEETLRWAAAGLKFIETGVAEAGDWMDNLPIGAPREPGEDPDEGPPPQDPPY